MNPFIGQIMFFAGNFAPRGWAFCDGQLLQISQNTALFSILGTTYGGDGRTTFGLPDFRGRMAINQGSGPGLPNYSLGEKTGNSSTVLSVANLPNANVQFGGATEGVDPEPNGKVPGLPDDDSAVFAPRSQSTTQMKPGSLVGAQNTAFSNESPYLGMYFIIALQGVYPSRS